MPARIRFKDFPRHRSKETKTFYYTSFLQPFVTAVRPPVHLPYSRIPLSVTVPLQPLFLTSTILSMDKTNCMYCLRSQSLTFHLAFFSHAASTIPSHCQFPRSTASGATSVTINRFLEIFKLTDSLNDVWMWVKGPHISHRLSELHSSSLHKIPLCVSWQPNRTHSTVSFSSFPLQINNWLWA